ncbi:general odorant-binding protein 83a [Copidosoma floridanum]|uniref:Odorant-binding protein 1 n=1 Tax=Copidosoma floridanum TaxID=29053 RepID=Q2Q1Y9_COPFL|nr:general odorant-binding protein 83a [Copidosoma floridanum]ABB58734.1 odorant-binding protein 1 [Copidosoma floridanum]
MKHFAAVVLFVAVCFVGAFSESLSNEEAEKLMEYKESCTAETGVDEAVLMQPYDDKEELVQDEKLNCYFACILKKMDMMDSDGTINMETARSQLLRDLCPKKIDESVECLSQVGDSPCNTAGKIFGCIMKIRTTCHDN